MEIKVLLTFEAPRLADGEHLRRALQRSAKRLKTDAQLVASSYSAPAATLDEEGE